MSGWRPALLLIVVILLLNACSFSPGLEIPSPAAKQDDQNTSGQPHPSDNASKPQLSNPNATEATRRIYEQVCSLTGTGALSGQQESTWMGSADYEMDHLWDITGKLPAMRGFDYMKDDFAGVNARAISWQEQGGLVTICWHTGADFTGEWNEAMKTEVADWDAVLTEGTASHEAFIAGMDKAAAALLALQEKGVTVFWRPFHEFDGAWFWWGKGGSDRFRKLWRLMYDRYTTHWKLNNLIWVLGYSNKGIRQEDWYPGDEVCDILGADSYDGGAQEGLYRKVRAVTDAPKPLCFHECGTNPTVAELQDVPWVWFMTWHTKHLTEENTPDALKALYNSTYVVTRDEFED